MRRHPQPRFPPPRPRDVADGFTLTRDGLYLVPGIAVVQAQPYRRPREARELARRIAGDARAYLPVLIGLRVPGVTDLRPLSHARPGFPRPAPETPNPEEQAHVHLDPDPQQQHQRPREPAEAGR